MLQAVNDHADGFVRFKALTLLTGFSDPRTEDAMDTAMASPNDRLREVAYAYFEQNPAPALAPKLLAALDKEEGEFVRPALVRALAAMAKDPKVAEVLMRDAMRGVDYFRSTVIEAIGDYKIAAAMPRLVEIAKLEGPLAGRRGDGDWARSATRISSARSPRCSSRRRRKRSPPLRRRSACWARTARRTSAISKRP